MANYRAVFAAGSAASRKRSKVIPLFGAAVILALSGTAAAAATGSLPAPIQSFVHSAVGAPAAPVRLVPQADPTPSDDATPSGETSTPSDETSPTASKSVPVGPDATGPDAYGLCTAWTAHQRNGATPDSVAFKNLATAAGGEGNIAAYCATVMNGKTSTPEPTEAQPTGTEAPQAGRPSTVPAATKANSHAEGKPTALPTQAKKP